MTEMDIVDWSMLTTPELLTLIGGILDKLHGSQQEDSGDDLARARYLQQALAEVHERAASLCPPPRLACSCGLTFTTPDELDDHFFDVFVPTNDIGHDQRAHFEISTG